jgi:hypothetical protein
VNRVDRRYGLEKCVQMSLPEAMTEPGGMASGDEVRRRRGEDSEKKILASLATRRGLIDTVSFRRENILFYQACDSVIQA